MICDGCGIHLRSLEVIEGKQYCRICAKKVKEKSKI
jgi:hypothetical protein